MIRRILSWIFSIIGFIFVLFCLTVFVMSLVKHNSFSEQFIDWIGLVFDKFGI
ncbi:MAG: hypothetical protein KBS91_01615 [Firmicutes bacterium]|nr:hypothetical protein [Candidatus Caballimonas caccae]